ncbi:MAG: hypothetical protein WBB74_10760 [Gaiellaceae bacterium]
MSAAKICRRVLVSALLLAAWPAQLAASDGAGRMDVTPKTVAAGTKGTALVFTFTADSGALRGQTLVDVPRLWSMPQASKPGAAGYVTLQRGSCGAGTRIVRVVGRKILINAFCGRGGRYTLTYAPVDVATLAPNGYVFLTQTRAAPKPGASVQARRRLRFHPLAPGKQPIVVVTGAPIDHLQVIATSVAGAGTAFGLTVRGVDAYGNTAGGYANSVTFTSTDPNATLPIPYKFSSADAGSHAFSGVALRTVGVQHITATDDAGHSATSNPINVSASS